MGQDRLGKMRRIARVQADLHRMAEWRLDQLRRQSEENAAAQRTLVASLNEHDALHGLFVDTMARRLGRLAVEADDLGRATETQQERVRQEALRLKRSERAADRLARRVQETEDRRGLQALLETFVNRGDASAT